jgi:hypothetical protein
MNRSTRIVAVTAGLLVAGAVAGALAADAALLIAVATTDGFGPMPADALAFVAALGALFGGVLLPITAWLFLRRVPLGLALLGTVLGTIAGGALGWIAQLGTNQITGGILGAVIGFACAALLLRRFASAPRVRRGVPTRG